MVRYAYFNALSISSSEKPHSRRVLYNSILMNLCTLYGIVCGLKLPLGWNTRIWLPFPFRVSISAPSFSNARAHFFCVKSVSDTIPLRRHNNLLSDYFLIVRQVNLYSVTIRRCDIVICKDCVLNHLIDIICCITTSKNTVNVG